jgi:hypothetical protein
VCLPKQDGGLGIKNFEVCEAAFRPATPEFMKEWSKGQLSMNIKRFAEPICK